MKETCPMRYAAEFSRVHEFDSQPLFTLINSLKKFDVADFSISVILTSMKYEIVIFFVELQFPQNLGKFCYLRIF